jgi:hypothetical protein
MWNLVLVRLEIVLGSVQYWCIAMALLGDEAQVGARFGPFGDNANLTQDRCTACFKRSIGCEIILGASDGTP